MTDFSQKLKITFRKVLNRSAPIIEMFRNPSRAKEIAQLRNVHRKNPKLSYELGSSFLQKEPHNEFAAYVAGWGSWKLRKYSEAILFMDKAIQANPNNFNYYYIRGEASRKLEKLQEAFIDFQEVVQRNPGNTAAWKNLARIKYDLSLDIPLEKNYTVVNHEVGQAFADRRWNKFQEYLHEMKKIDPLAAEYWALSQEEFFTRLPNPARDWQNFHQKALAHKHEVAFIGFCNMFNWFVKEGDIAHILVELPKFASVYHRPCPLHNVPGVCAILVKNRHFRLCLDFIDETVALQTDDESRKNVDLRAYQYHMLCNEQLGVVAETSKDFDAANPITGNLFQKLLDTHHPISSAGIIAKQCLDCWKHIQTTSNDLLLDLRYNELQAIQLRSKIMEAVRKKMPLSLLRLGDSDSYGFSEMYSNYSDSLVTDTETMWWGKTIEKTLKHKLVKNFLEALVDADIIGLPSSIRLARDLKVEQRTTMSTIQTKYQTLFAGIQDLLDQRKIRTKLTWVDEYCNFSLANEEFIQNIVGQSVNVVLVTCFNIPPAHFLDQPKVSTIRIPPHSRVASICNPVKTASILPEIIDKKILEFIALVKPGSLVLVSAGFAGKTFVQIGKALGAVAIDFGSAMDDLFGYKTRSSELHVQSSKADEKEEIKNVKELTIPTDHMVIKIEDINNSGRHRCLSKIGSVWRRLHRSNF